MGAFDVDEEAGPMKIVDLNQYSREINVVVKVIQDGGARSQRDGRDPAQGARRL
jgi:hypothetical protein